ncbi:putative F-box protein At5g55150 [Apium graveolens]|uniref:putative F-box protein At5g55150 n=1 Tax=Apium graveolens TaxID=4045 RepID=UPI003D7AB1C9
MDDHVNWDELPSELLELIANKLSSCEDIVRFSAVSKSWKSVLSGLSEDEKPVLPPESPILFLAEQVAEGGALSCDFNDEYEEGLEEDGGDGLVGTTRGLYRLATGKTCNIELPEASGKLILGTNKGWLLTLGIDLEINLLHPLSRKQIQLPPIGAFPRHNFSLPEKDFDMFIRKVAMSSKIQSNKNLVTGSGTYSPNPLVMTIYGEGDYLGFARLGDKVWTNIEILFSIQDIAYYNGKFYAVNSQGDVFVCDIDDDYNNGGRARGTKIASCALERSTRFGQRYLVESGSGLWLVVRFCKLKYFKPPHHSIVKYRTADFSVWKLELEYSDDCSRPPSCTCTQTNNLGDEALFIGKATCLSLPSSEYIKPNCIYFTDDTWELSNCMGGGHDMGIFNMESSTIEPFYNGKFIHPISPPVWYI